MKRIIIPTDFSDISRNAISFGFCLARQIGGNISLVHVLELYKFSAGTSETEILSTILPSDNIRDMELAAEENFKKMLDELKNEIGTEVPIEYKVTTGHLVNEVLSEAAKEDTLIVVMGVASSQDLFTRFTEGTVSAIIDAAECPVMVVPSGRKYCPFNKVMYATDFKKADLLAIQQLQQMLASIKPTLKVVHVTSKPDDFSTELKLAGFKQKLNEKNQETQIETQLYTNKNIVKGIIEASEKENADLIVLLKGHESFFKSLFETSRADKITHFLRIPMISFREKKS